ncbi:MAG: Abi-alpha family protein [Woeseiaceae bacterium]|nr:Abi-alpha family protein [Woeseiaceae bacterium]
MSKGVKAGGFSEAVGTLIAKLCYRAADDLGEELAAYTGKLRQRNALKILEEAAEKHALLEDYENRTASPRLAYHIIDEGSWTEDDRIHSFWAGLLASSCTEDGGDEGNLIFVNTLKQLTSLEARILEYACEQSQKTVTSVGWVMANPLTIRLEDLIALTGESDIHRLDREMDHLRSLELLATGGFSPGSTSADITPSAFALHMYTRCQGYVGSPVDFFGLELNAEDSELEDT